MAQLITTTDISVIRPVFAKGTAENIKRYNQIKRLYQAGKEYRILAEPVPAPGNKIAWHTEYDGKIINFADIPDDEKQRLKGRLKSQINKLYKEAFKIIKEAHGEAGSVEELFEVIDSCIEIPDYNDIYIIKEDSGRSNFVIIRWGFTYDDFNAPTGLIAKLVPIKVDNVKIKVIEGIDNLVVNRTINIEYNNKKVDLVTDNQGCIYLEDIPFFTKIHVSKKKGSKITDEQTFICDGSDEYIFRIGVKAVNMNLKFVDTDGNPIKSTDISITVGQKQQIYTTDTDGRILLENIPVGTQVVCEQDSETTKTFICEEFKTEYVFVGYQPNVAMIFKLVDEKHNPLSNNKLRIEYKGRTVELDTDKNGIVEIQNFPVGGKVAVSQIINGKVIVSQDFITDKVPKEYVIVGEKKPPKGRMNFRIIDEYNKPISNAKLKLEFNGKTIYLNSDEEGYFYLENITYGTQIKCFQIIDNVAALQHSFVYEEDKDLYIMRGKYPKPFLNSVDVTVQVLNAKREPHKNLKVTIENGHDTYHKYTDDEGKAIFTDLDATKLVRIIAEYKSNKEVLEVRCEKESEFYQIVLGKKAAWIWWILLAIIILGSVFYFFVLPMLNKEPNQKDDIVAVPDTTQQIMQKQPENKGFTVKVLTKNTNKPVQNANIEITTGDSVYTGQTDANGSFTFPITDTTLQIQMKVSANGFTEQILTFNFTHKKTVYLSNESIDVSEIILPCGKQVESKGYHSTVKTFHLKKDKGRSLLAFNMFSIPDKIIVYQGKTTQPDKIIWSTDGFVRGFHKKYINFNSPDSLLTIEIKGGDNSKTEWYFTIYCPK